MAQKLFVPVANLFLRFAFWLLTRLEISGLENVPKEGALMVICNHISFLDPVLLSMAIPRHIIWMAKAENWRNPLLGLILTLYGAFPVQRGEVDRRALGRALQVLRSGGVLGIAPEGTRSRVGRMARAKPGAARLALETDATILPVGVAGTETAVRLWARLRRPLITMRVGKPFKLPAERQYTKEQQQMFADFMMYRIAELVPPQYRGVYAVEDLDN